MRGGITSWLPMPKSATRARWLGPIFPRAKCGSCPASAHGLGRNWRGWPRAKVLLADPMAEALRPVIEDMGAALTALAPASFDSGSAERRLCDLYGVQTLDGFGQFGRPERAALGALVDYLDLTQRGKLPLLQPPTVESADAAVQIDAATRRNLELTQALSGGA